MMIKYLTNICFLFPPPSHLFPTLGKGDVVGAILDLREHRKNYIALDKYGSCLAGWGQLMGARHKRKNNIRIG